MQIASGAICAVSTMLWSCRPRCWPRSLPPRIHMSRSSKRRRPPRRLRRASTPSNKALPSERAPVLLWHGTKESLDGLVPLRGGLEEFSRETSAELSIVTNREEATEQWGTLRVRYIAWSPETLATVAARTRLGIVPARPTLADSYLKSAGRLRCLFALGCPAIGDARSPDVVAFSEACGLPSANTCGEWLTALRRLWHEPARLDATALRGHALVREQYSAARTARQWLWFFATATKSE